ncbi:site-specific integrase [Dyadobacter jiangsuensis]|uniref:Phage integrase family protein n=1 Tax=Dyadobacter jiangsuensis TaxID=1591085 RepID=A0A2P8FAQ5_9BACT|nr:site-specific integrase [Dyadobacter jiangsuensis]PSL18805.1 phage integrase family protein [Dyadobacter jiangsuensis]
MRYSHKQYCLMFRKQFVKGKLLRPQKTEFLGQNFRKAEYKAVVKKLKHRLRAIKAESGDGVETNPTIEKIIKLRIVRDIFLFCCYNGLSYADVKNLSNSHIFSGFDGRRWITIKRQKTDVPSRIPLLPVPEAILKKYLGHVKCQNDRVLSVLSNQKMNAYLKEIGDVCGINKEITFHLAQHTFATTVTLANDVAIESISKMLGHKNIKTTQYYAKIVDKKISIVMISLTEKLHVMR